MTRTTDLLFADDDEARRLFEAVTEAIGSVGAAHMRVTKSQVAFSRRIGFAWVWRPRQYLGRGAPLVLTLGLRRRLRSKRWKQVVEPRRGRFTHHLELYDVSQLDSEVCRWIREAWEGSG